MFDDIYDNGECLLGKVKWIKDYLCKNAEDPGDVKEIVEDLENYDEDTIVAVNYDHGMGYSIDYWTYNDIVNKP